MGTASQFASEIALERSQWRIITALSGAWWVASAAALFFAWASSMSGQGARATLLYVLAGLLLVAQGMNSARLYGRWRRRRALSVDRLPRMRFVVMTSLMPALLTLPVLCLVELVITRDLALAPVVVLLMIAGAPLIALGSLAPSAGYGRGR